VALIGVLVVGTDCVGVSCTGNGILPGTFSVSTGIRPGKMYVQRADPKSVVAKETNQP
jgi:hypothetical protein